jgi:hypothetical protein
MPPLAGRQSTSWLAVVVGLDAAMILVEGLDALQAGGGGIGEVGGDLIMQGGLVALERQDSINRHDWTAKGSHVKQKRNFASDIRMGKIPLNSLVLVGTILLLPAVARADGDVVRASGCGDRVFVSSPSGYSTLEISSEPGVVVEKDHLVGNVESIGHVMLFDETSARTVSAVVEDSALSKGQLVGRIAARCREPLSMESTTATVDRVKGCNGKAFVATPEGFAELELVSGGSIAEGDHLVGKINRLGRVELRHQEADGTVNVFVDNYRLSQTTVERLIATNCH